MVEAVVVTHGHTGYQPGNSGKETMATYSGCVTVLSANNHYKLAAPLNPITVAQVVNWEESQHHDL